jgi:hypothetical protein
VNIVDQPLMSSMVVGRYRSANGTNPRRGYQESYVVTTSILDHRVGHFVRPNRVTFKYPDFKKDVDPDVHVRVFNYVVKVNANFFEEYIINAFSITLRDTTSGWCHNYMSKFIDYIFSELTHAFCKHHQKTQNDKEIYVHGIPYIITSIVLYLVNMDY